MEPRFQDTSWVASSRLQIVLGFCGFAAFFMYEGRLPSSSPGSAIGMGFLGSLLALGALKAIEYVPAKHRLIATVGLLGAVILWFLNAPHNYNDCILQGIKGAQNEQAAQYIRIACQKKYGR